MIPRQLLELTSRRPLPSEGSVSVTLTRPPEVALPPETTMGRVYDLPAWYFAPYQVQDRIPYDVTAFDRWQATTMGEWTPRDENAYQRVLEWMRDNEPATRPEGPWERFGPTAIARLGQLAGYAIQAFTGAPVGSLISSASAEVAALVQADLDADAATEALQVAAGLRDPELTRYRLDWYLYTASAGYRYDPVSGVYSPIGAGYQGFYKPSRLRPADYGSAPSPTAASPRPGTAVPGIGLGLGLRGGGRTRGPGRPSEASGPSWWTLGLLAVGTAAALIAF